MIEGVRVFDTILDSSNIKDTISRNSADWKFSYERVHSLSDLSYFCSKKIKENVIIFSGHGNSTGGFYLSNGECFSPESDLSFPEKNHDKIIIFSSCLIGDNERLCLDFKKFFNAEHIFAYRHEMQDRFCFLNESILLTFFEHKTLTSFSHPNFTKKDFEDFQDKTDFMKNMNESHRRLHPMVMY
ncbi:MAG: hypothetical protein WCI11_06215 [Candidatus Methylumidiphilus sp.]